MTLYEFARGLCRGFAKLFYRVNIIGEENIPKTGAVILCANHTSNLDPVLLGSTKRRPFAFMAKESLTKIPVIGIIIKNLDIIPVKRNGNDISAIKSAIRTLEENKAVIMFPEGTRNRTGQLGKAKNGVALLVKKTGAPVVPCAVQKKGVFRSSHVIIGKPINMSAYKDSKELDKITGEIMDNIKMLLKELPE